MPALATSRARAREKRRTCLEFWKKQWSPTLGNSVVLLLEVRSAVGEAKEGIGNIQPGRIVS